MTYPHRFNPHPPALGLADRVGQAEGRCGLREERDIGEAPGLVLDGGEQG